MNGLYVFLKRRSTLDLNIFSTFRIHCPKNHFFILIYKPKCILRKIKTIIYVVAEFETGIKFNATLINKSQKHLGLISLLNSKE